MLTQYPLPIHRKSSGNDRRLQSSAARWLALVTPANHQSRLLILFLLFGPISVGCGSGHDFSIRSATQKDLSGPAKNSSETKNSGAEKNSSETKNADPELISGLEDRIAPAQVAENNSTPIATLPIEVAGDKGLPKELSRQYGDLTLGGALTFIVDGDVDLESVDAYVVGQPSMKATLNSETNSEPERRFTLRGFPGIRDIIITARTSSSNEPIGVRINAQEFDQSKKVDIGMIELPPVGSITGKVTLHGQENHTGVRVSIPGTSFLATTNIDGSYVITPFVPEGIDTIFFEHQGYKSAIGQVSSDTASIPEIELFPSGNDTLPSVTCSQEIGCALIGTRVP